MFLMYTTDVNYPTAKAGGVVDILPRFEYIIN